MSKGNVITIVVDYDRVTIKQPGEEPTIIMRSMAISVLEWHAIWDTFNACLDGDEVSSVESTL